MDPKVTKRITDSYARKDGIALIFVVSGKNPELGLAELEAVLRKELHAQLPLAFLEIDHETIMGTFRKMDRVALTREAYIQVSLEAMSSAGFGTYDLLPASKARMSEGLRSFRSSIAEGLQSRGLRRKYRTPAATLRVFDTPLGPGLGLRVWQNNNDFASRTAHKLKRPHPTGTDPRIARAMVNLAGLQTSMLDPFCGAGGILIEAALCGMKPIGIDIDREMAGRAQTNLSSLGLKADIRAMDALEWRTQVPCVVTDLPYGKSSRLEMPLSELISRFLEAYKPITKEIILGFPDTQEHISTIDHSGWVVKKSFTQYIHRSLSKRIMVLEPRRP